MNEAQRYVSVGRLIEEQPDDADEHAVLRWIGRATAIAKEIDFVNAAELAAISSTTHIAGTIKTVQRPMPYSTDCLRRPSWLHQCQIKGRSLQRAARWML